MMNWHKILILVVFMGVFFHAEAVCQEDYKIYRAIIENGDTIFSLPEVVVIPKKVFANRRHEIRYTKLVRNLKIIYPYVVLMRKEFAKMDYEYSRLTTDKERRQYMKELENVILKQHEKDLKNLTISQGRLLIKLVDRETGNTSYKILKDFRGGVSATFWQGIARIFGSNLKTQYDPLHNEEDSEIEEILHYIELGAI